MAKPKTKQPREIKAAHLILAKDYAQQGIRRLEPSSRENEATAGNPYAIEKLQAGAAKGARIGAHMGPAAGQLLHIGTALPKARDSIAHIGRGDPPNEMDPIRSILTVDGRKISSQQIANLPKTGQVYAHLSQTEANAGRSRPLRHYRLKKVDTLRCSGLHSAEPIANTPKQLSPVQRFQRQRIQQQIIKGRIRRDASLRYERTLQQSTAPYRVRQSATSPAAAQASAPASAGPTQAMQKAYKHKQQAAMAAQATTKAVGKTAKGAVSIGRRLPRLRPLW